MENSIYRNKKKNNSANGIFAFLYLFYLVWRTPFVGFYTNTYLAMLVLMGFCALLLFVKNRWTIQSFVFLFLIIVVTILDFISNIVDGKGFIMSIWEMFLAVFPIIAGCCIVNNRMNFVARKFVFVSIIVYVITAITTFIGVLRFPGASRLLAADPLAHLKFYPLNIGGFDFIYSLVLLHPLAVYLLRKLKRTHYAIPFSIIALGCIIVCEYTMAVILYIISLLAYLLPIDMNPVAAKRRMRNIVIASVILIVFVPLIFSFLSKIEFLGSVGEKLFDISSLLQGETVQEESGVAIRQNIYLKSWNAFLERPIIGSKLYGTPTVGGHSYILDTLGNWGVMGLVVVLLLFNRLRIFYKKTFKNKETYYCASIFLLMVFILWTLNPKIWQFEIGLMCPVFLYCIENTEHIIPRRKRRR